jgi:hypothetical protein
MRLGGHETFYLRPGWLTKGLTLVASGDDRGFADPEVADELGVGRNMAKSIGFWLQATSIAARADRASALALTPFGGLLHEHDRYLQHGLSWWVIHINLSRRPDTIWSWFWNGFRLERFDRLHCQESLTRAIDRSGDKLPSAKALQREVAVLLQTYRRALPAETTDPEDNLDCPLRQLDLLTLHVDLDRYERRSAWGRLPPEALAYCLAVGHEAADDVIEIGFAEALNGAGGPGRLFNLDADGLSDALGAAERAFGARVLRTRLLGGERVIQREAGPPIAWLERHFDHVRAA